jgi:glyoxylase-like metal-dependent hydrolase (beta-lactamase superfamily II)
MEPIAIVPGLWQVPLGFVNAFLVDGGEDGVVVVDTGVAGSGAAILGAVGAIGKSAGDVRHVVVTHCHSDHAGGLAELKRATGAAAWMHEVDAALVRRGEALRALRPAPGLMNALICKFLLPSAPTTVEPAEVEHEVGDGETLPGGLVAVHAPGHCAGQVALLWPKGGGVLIAADAAANVFGLAVSPLYEDHALGVRSLAKIATLEFEAAVFGHGKAMVGGASGRFRRKWGTR